MPSELPRGSIEHACSSEHADTSVFSSLNAQNPWPGLAAYDEASRDFFNGRDEETEELLRLIRLAPLTALYGKSGLGKSSLLQAGLFPLLRAAHYLPVNLRIDYSDAADSALERVAQRFMEELRRAKAEFTPRGDESLWEYLHRKDLEIWTTDNFPLTPVLVFDQFEEGKAKQAQAELVTLVGSPSSPLDCSWASEKPSVFGCQMRIDPPLSK